MENLYEQEHWPPERSSERALNDALERKLQLLADGEDMELTPEEAAVYGADYADEWEDDNVDLSGEEEHG